MSKHHMGPSSRHNEGPGQVPQTVKHKQLEGVSHRHKTYLAAYLTAYLFIVGSLADSFAIPSYKYLGVP